MPITPKAIQDLLDELEASKQSRLRAWNVLQRLRLVLSEAGNVAISPPAQKTFDAEGEVLEHALTKSFRIRNEAIKSLCSSVRTELGWWVRVVAGIHVLRSMPAPTGQRWSAGTPTCRMGVGVLDALSATPR